MVLRVYICGTSISMFRKIIKTDKAETTILIRLMVGTIFLSEGIQKFIFAEKLGVGRFAKIGLPNTEVLAPFVGTMEILCGALILIGLITRLAAIPLFSIVVVAIMVTKLELIPSHGLWHMLHESRTDWAMLLGCVFLGRKGGGGWSIDRLLHKRK
jgi:putative oxidoreductase